MNLTISLAQSSFEVGNVEDNFEKGAANIVEAASLGSNIILLPELWASGYDLENWRSYATGISDGIFARVAFLAKKHNIAIGGSLLELHNGRAYNTFVLFSPKGSPWAIYRKIHLFRLLNEDKYLQAGEKLVFAKKPWDSVGLATCYDLRFPEIFQYYSQGGARLILLVAEWPKNRIMHWTKLLQARAIENQTFFAGVNKVGFSNSVRLGGCSAIIDPWGVPIVSNEDDDILLTAEIDLRETEKVRRYIPVRQDRRPDLYNRLIT
ncbi:MAG: carbon-nitrogen family hydrolase [Anaerolineae bacterium]|nr:carbon-nitrogen family hydrolase [Anaerolineae bacterium]